MSKETTIDGFIHGGHVEIKCSTREQADFLRIKLANWLNESNAPAYTEDESFWKNEGDFPIGPFDMKKCVNAAVKRGKKFQEGMGDYGAGLMLWVEAPGQNEGGPEETEKESEGTGL